MNKWDGIEAFVHVVQKGSFKEAAATMNVSSSHVSRKVAELEQRLGTTLIHRTTRSIRLSELGERYFEECLKVLEGFEQAEESISSQKESISGSIKISCAATFGERFIVPLLSEFLLEYPNINLDIHLSNARVDLVKDGYDLAIRVGTLEDSGLIARRLCDRKEYLCATPDYIKRNGYPKNLSEISEHNCLSISDSAWIFQQDGKRKDVRVSGNWSSNLGQAVLDATVSGLGVSQLPDYYVEQLIADKVLVSLLENYQYPFSGVWLVYPKERRQLSRLKLLCDYLSDSVNDKPWLIS